MTIIGHMTGVSTGAYLATVLHAGEKILSVTPMAGNQPTLMAVRQVPVPKMVLNIAARCGIVPPETGKLTMQEVDAKLTAGSVRQEDRITLKRELSRAGIL